MSRRAVPLTLDHLAELDAPCRECVFWELDPVRRGRVEDCGGAEAAREKEAWFSHVLREWGSCGRVVLVDGHPVGYAVYAPAAFVPGADQFATAPVSPDAVLLTTVWIDPEHARGGLGRVLVQGMARDLVKRDIRAVEAFGDLRGTRPRRRRAAAEPDPSGPEHSSSCLVPADFLGRVGFKTQRAHPRTPRMRMELRSALSWRDEVEAAIERLVGVVRPEKAPSPAPKATRTVRESD